MKKAIWICLTALLCILAASASADVIISEVMASNGYYEDGHAWDWIELYNDGEKTADLSGWYLSDSGKNPLKWQFPQGTKLKAGKVSDRLVHRGGGFRSRQWQRLLYRLCHLLRRGNADPVRRRRNGMQRLKLPAQYGCVSYGLPREGGEYGFFENATRGKQNDRRPSAHGRRRPRFPDRGRVLSRGA